METNKIPVISSTMGYWRLREEGQYRHFPFKKIKESRGIRSNQARVFLHDSQYDLPVIDSFRGILSIKTFKKEHMDAPNKNMIILFKSIGWFRITCYTE